MDTPAGVDDVIDFLSGQPPFDALAADDLARVAAHVEIERVAAEVVVVRPDNHEECLRVVRSGSLEVLDGGQVVDLLGPGDCFGQTTSICLLPATATVRARVASVCLRMPDPRGFLEAPQRLTFGRVMRPARGPLLADGGLSPLTRALREVMRPVVWCRPDDRIADVARQIGATNQSCALLRTPDGLGIVTDHDFRERVAGGDLSPDQPIVRAATIPALTIGADDTQTVGLLRMVEHGCHHLVVVDADEPVGIVRAVDLARTELREPLTIRSAVASAQTIDELATAGRLLPATIAELRDAGLSAVHIGAIQAAITDAVVRRAIVLDSAANRVGVRLSWVLLGSLARREPLPRSDLDTALIWADPPASEPDPADQIRSSARRVLTDLGRCGLTPCANGANADNPLFSRSRSAWARAAKGWLDDPTREGALLLSAMVADSRPLTDLPLGLGLTESIRSHTRTSQFLRALLDQALAWRPPTGFVRDFIVEHSGEHRGELDLKRAGLAPVVGLGRWLAIATGDSRGTTPERVRQGAAAGLLTADEADVLVRSFEDIYGLVLDHELADIRSGRPPQSFVAPKKLDSLTRRQLRETFRAIARVQQRADLDWIWRLTK